MPVIHRDSPVSPSFPPGPPCLEDLLRDAAAFASAEEVPQGLAHRALARRIAAQKARAQSLSSRPGQRQSRLLWLGGLSAGTLTGALAAVLLIAHTGGDRLSSPATPRAVPPLAMTASADTSPKRQARTILPPLPVPALRPALAAAAPAASKPEPHGVKARRHRQMFTAARLVRPLRLNSDNREAAEPAPSPARWKTETVDETAYQLVTTAYVSDTDKDVPGSTNSESDKNLTPVQMQICLEPAEQTPCPVASDLK